MTAITAAHHFFDDPIERRAYFAEEIRRMDEQSLIEGNRREAKEEGIAEGEAKAEERLVLNLLKHVDLMDAAFMLNLDVDKVRSIAKKFGLRH